MEVFRNYRRSLQPDRRTLLEGYHFADLARKVVGVGSVGTRCWIMLLLGRDNGDPLFLQIKETGPSALESVLGRSQYRNHGQRVVEGQRLMQAASDIFLGWIHVKAGLDGQPRDFYVRQLWDWKASADLDTILPLGLELYAERVRWTLARAHARSGDRIAIAVVSRQERRLRSCDRRVRRSRTPIRTSATTTRSCRRSRRPDPERGGHLARLGGTCHSSALAPGRRRARRRPRGASTVRRLVRRRAPRPDPAWRAVRRRGAAGARGRGRIAIFAARRRPTRTRPRRSAQSTADRRTARSSRLRRA